MAKWLKLCFSYCAVFRKGHNIVKYDLIHQWIALGFIEPSGVFDSMQLCEKYVTQLLGMSFLQYSKTSSVSYYLVVLPFNHSYSSIHSMYFHDNSQNKRILERMPLLLFFWKIRKYVFHKIIIRELYKSDRLVHTC